MHRYLITSGPDPSSGVFDWHYIQCVLQRFATEEYRGMDNIAYFALPFRTRDDDDYSDQFNNTQDPPYPSYPTLLTSGEVSSWRRKNTVKALRAGDLIFPPEWQPGLLCLFLTSLSCLSLLGPTCFKHILHPSCLCDLITSNTPFAAHLSQYHLLIII